MYFLIATLAFVINLYLTLAQTAITINTKTTYQTIDGFGFSEAFGFGVGVQNAPSSQQNQALNYMFNLTSGAGFTILRNRIAADPSDTIEPTRPSSPSATPTYVWNDNDESQVFWATKARDMGVQYIYADAWSAPGFMKTNNNYEDGGSLCGVEGATCSSGDWRQAYANYLVAYIQKYKSVGITIDFVGFLNEPEFNATYDGMLSNGTQAASFIPILYQTLQSAGLATGITCCDAEGWADQAAFTDQIIAADAAQYLARITSHWYLDQGTAPLNTTLRVWQSEWCDLNDDFSTTWFENGAFNEGLTWANYIYQGLVDCDLSAFLYWVGSQSYSNAAGLVTLTGSGSSTVVKPSSVLWAFAMFSRYIRPDAVRVSTSGSLLNTNIAAFQNTDGTVVVVMINNGSSTENVSLAGIAVSSVTAYYIDNSVSVPAIFNATFSAGVVGGTLPPYSVVTFVLVVQSNTTSTIMESTTARSQNLAQRAHNTVAKT